MKLKETSYADFEKTVSYICSLCGFPSVTGFKLNTLADFMRSEYGQSTLEDLQNAFVSLASGRLDEKLEGVKSLTGMTASRVLQSYMRNRKQEQPAKIEQKDGKDRSFVNDENRQLLFDKFGRWYTFADELGDAENNYLMEHWVEENRKAYKGIRKPYLLTASSFDYFERMGTLRVKDGMLQYFENKTYNDLMPWSQVEQGGVRLKYSEETMLAKSREGSLIRNMGLRPAVVTLEDATKRYAVSVYFETIL